jgi:hypothetical protein
MTEHQPAPPRTFRVIAGGGVPPTALTWNSRAQRNRRLEIWRSAIFAAFGDQTRCLRVAWVLAGLFHTDKGYAYPSDSYLATATGLPVNKLQATLTALDRGGGIVRSHVFQPNGRSQRRIYPASALIPPTVGGVDTPQQLGGQNLNRKRRPKLSQQELALLDAERQAGKDRKPPTEDDEGDGP